MEVQGKVHTKVEVNPVEVIEGLITRFLNGDKYDNWINSENGKHFLMHSRREYHNRVEEDVICELTQEDVDYFNALKFVKKYLEEHKITK